MFQLIPPYSKEFGMVALCFIMILAYFPSKPKNPPSISAAEERSDFITGIKAIVW